MLKFRLVYGPAGAGKTRFCLTEIRDNLLREPEGAPLILLLPEQATFQVERELADTPGLDGFARAYVLGFRRLAHRVFLETGGSLRPRITEMGKRLILRQLLLANREKLKVFQRAAKERNFAATLAGLIQEFKNYGVSPVQLKAALPNLPPSLLADKLCDLTLIFSGLETFLQGRYDDPEDDLQLLAEKIPQSLLLRGSRIWVDGFSWFTPREYAVIKKLTETAEEVTVTLCIDQPGSPSRQLETDLFHRQWNTLQKLKAMVRQGGGEWTEIPLMDTRRFVNPFINHLARQFFVLPLLPYPAEPSGVAVAEAANRRTEVEGMARAMIRLAREQGWRWRDMAVLLRDGDSYGDVVETVFADFEIPLFSDRHRQGVHHPLAELVRSALEVVVENWNYEAVFRTLKTGFFPVERDEIDRLENYVLEFGIRGNAWLKHDRWNYVRRYSLEEDQEISNGQEERLVRIHSIRQCTAELVRFCEKLRAAATVRQYTLALYDFLAALQVPDSLVKWGGLAEQKGDLEQSKEHKQVWDGILELLDQLVEAFGETEIALAEYADIISEGLEGLELSLVPPGLDYVAVSSLERTRIANARAVFIPGVTEGILPQRAQGEGMITDAERQEMARLGVEIGPGQLSNTFAEQFLVYTALTRASHYLWLSYPLADRDGKSLAPSYVIKRVRELAGGLPVTGLAVEPEPDCIRDYLVHPRQSLAYLATSLRVYKNGGAFSSLWRDVYNWARQNPVWQQKLAQITAGLFHCNQAGDLDRELARSLYVSKNVLRGSVTRFESFQACPFKHFAQYGLSLRERAMFRLEAPDFGQFLHAALKEFGERILAEGRGWGSLDERERAERVAVIIKELAPKLQNEILLSSGQYRHITGRLQKTAAKAVERLAAFDRGSLFKPFALEQTFGGEEGSLPPLAFSLPDGIRLELAGRIDRLDAALYNGREYILIIDYKSGGAWLTLPEVYHGLKLQLLIYLLAACSLGLKAEKAEYLPAGILYFFLRNPSVSEPAFLSPAEVEKKINQALKMPGWVLDDPAVVKQIDGMLAGPSEFLKVGLNKDGTFSKMSRPYLKTAEEFRLLLAHARFLLQNTARGILSGRSDIAPYMLDKTIACTHCSFAPVCQFDLLLPENEYRQLENKADPVIMSELAGKEEGSI
ncbi:dna helicase subunit addb [Lucifera butyrica]|uniref:Dna helicase subunit addb n=1 Tax=Lucifera butyrica TaxID=1351585 RepID=A0A498R146_9FIRM|nr:helicase-exonuclease AddAB subunit AddB [Lucifera butyrica]VBB05051.1 dna helicase subunit addb [Lucifera butyrica]